MASLEPRKGRIAVSDNCSRSRAPAPLPSVNRISPRVRACGGNRRIKASDVTDFPEPDSPTSPRTSPGAMEKLRSRTATRRPPPPPLLERGNSTTRFRTSRRSTMPKQHRLRPDNMQDFMEDGRPRPSCTGHRRDGRDARPPSELRNTSLLPQNQRQPILAVANYNHFSVRALGQALGRFNALPFQQLRTDPLGHNLLEVANAGGFNAFALGLLRFLLQAEVHGQCFLLGLLFRFDGRFQRGR